MLIAVSEADSKTYRRLAAKSIGTPSLDSGNYKHAFAVTETRPIRPGMYVVLVSTYHAGQVGTFTLSIASSIKVEAEPIP